MRFYAGAPVRLATGDVVGSVCVFDVVARAAPDPTGAALLLGLAAAVGHLLDLRRELIARRAAERRLAEHARLLEMAESMAGLGTWRLNFLSGDLHLSPTIFGIYGLDPSQAAPDVDAVLALYDPADRSRIADAIAEARATGDGYALDARLRRADGESRDVSVKARVECDGAGRPVTLIGVLQDVTLEKRAMRVLDSRRIEADRRANRMRDLACVDVLTGLPNRRAFLERAEAALDRGGRVTLALLDIDHFKSINDRYGHAGGDAALAAFGRICARLAGPATCLGRIGGEEFALLDEDGEVGVAARLVEDLRQALSSEPMRLRGGVDLCLTFSAGLARSAPGDAWPALFGRADQALYRAKLDGRDRSAVAA